MNPKRARKVARPLWIGGMVALVAGWLVQNYATNASITNDLRAQLFWIANILIPLGVLAALIGGGLLLLAHAW